MKTILEIQKLDRQIQMLNREVAKCQASIDFNNYKKFLQEGKLRFEDLERQASNIIRNYESAQQTFNKEKGNTEILKKRNTDTMSLETAETLSSDLNSFLGRLSEDMRKLEDLVRKSEEVVRRSAELSAKLTEAKSRSNVIKSKIEEKRQEVAPKIAEIESKIKALEPQIKDIEQYKKYKEMKEKGIFPVFVTAEGNFCGGCKVELSLSFMDKLKQHGMLTCEHCNRIIMFK